MSSHLSSDSSAQISLLASISSKKNIVFKALLLAFYKSWSKVEIIQVISRLFFIMFLPYAYEDLQCKNDIRAFIDELEESEEIDKILIRAVEIEDKRRFDILFDEERTNNDPNQKAIDYKGLSIHFINEINNLMGSNYIQISIMIQLAVKVAILVIPETIRTYDEHNYKAESQNDPLYNCNDKLALLQISQYKALNAVYAGFEGLKPKSLYSYILDFVSYDFLYELLTLSVKLSFAGDEINGKQDCDKMISEIWLDACKNYTSSTIYSFISYMKYKLESKLQTTSANNSGEIFQRTAIILSSIYKIVINSSQIISDIIIERAANPSVLVLSKLIIEKPSISRILFIIEFVASKFKHSQEIYYLWKSILHIKEDVEDTFETHELLKSQSVNLINTKENSDFEELLLIENISSYIELITENKAEIEYLNKNYYVIIQNCFYDLDLLEFKIFDSSSDNSQQVINMVVMIMLILYNYRHFNKIIEQNINSNLNINK